MEKKKTFSLFHVNVDKIEGFNELSAADFVKATQTEKDEMVTSHKSVSYWADALRRFKRNTVSMVALFVFLAIVLFAFVGPLLIPYSYADQLRSSLNLLPGKYSEAEDAVTAMLGEFDAVFATRIQNGSYTALPQGDYFTEFKGTTYAFSFDKSFSSAAIVLDLNTEQKLFTIKESAYTEGDYTATSPLEYSAVPSEGATEIKLITRVFPHVFGTNTQGTDLMAQCMYGARVSIIVGICAAIIVLIIGATYGSISGLSGGAVDFVMMRVVDLIYSVPDVLIVLLLQVVLKAPLQLWFDTSQVGFVRSLSDLGVGIVSIFITFALLYWVGMARLIRGQVLMLKKQEYVTAATALGVPKGRIIKRHLLPNCVGQLMISTCLQIPSAIFLESFLSFLGLGVSAPMPSLGSLCSDALGPVTLYPHRLLIPGLILGLLVLSLNLVGDGLRDSLDPRLKK